MLATSPTLPQAAGLSPEALQDLIATVRAQVPEVVAIYLYGSRVQGRARPGSDLDVALLLPPGRRLDLAQQLDLAGRLAKVTGWDVDLAQLDLAGSVVHCKEVYSRGLRIWVGDALATAWFEMLTLSQYASFCEARQRVVEAYRQPAAEAAS